MISIGEYAAAGLYDPATDEVAGRLDLLRWLEELGFTLDEIIVGFNNGALGAMAGDRRAVPGARLSRAEAIERAGMQPEHFDEFARACGFVPIGGAPDGELGFTESEVRTFAELDVLSSLFSHDEAVGIVRVIGAALARIGDASVSLFLSDVESRLLAEGSSELDLALKVYEAVGLLDGLTARLDPILRRHVLQAIERSRRTIIGDLERFHYRYAVGFVDLVGFTARSAAMDGPELAAFLREFEGKAADVVTGAGARVVKLIGDEVMFVADDPASACAAAQELMVVVGTTMDEVVPRGGLAYGDVLVRGGDYYGSVVNLASRLVDEAVPKELLVTEHLARAAPAFHFEPAGRRMVKGFDEPILVQSLMAESG